MKTRPPPRHIRNELLKRHSTTIVNVAAGLTAGITAAFLLAPKVVQPIFISARSGEVVANVSTGKIRWTIQTEKGIYLCLNDNGCSRYTNVLFDKWLVTKDEFPKSYRLLQNITIS